MEFDIHKDIENEGENKRDTYVGTWYSEADELFYFDVYEDFEYFKKLLFLRNIVPIRDKRNRSQFVIAFTKEYDIVKFCKDMKLRIDGIEI